MTAGPANGDLVALHASAAVRNPIQVRIIHRDERFEAAAMRALLKEILYAIEIAQALFPRQAGPKLTLTGTGMRVEGSW